MIFAAFLVFISGFSALVYELLWLRHLGLIFGNTVYAATTVLVVFMGGFGIGAYFAGKWSERTDRPVWIFGVLQAVIGLYAVVMPYLFDLIRVAYKFLYQNFPESPMMLLSLRFVLALIILIVPTILMGATLPVLSAGLLREKEKFGRKLGLLYGLNTLGGVAGILSCGFLLIQLLGLRGTNLVAVAGNITAGVLSVVFSFRFDSSFRKTSNVEILEAHSEKCRQKLFFILVAIGCSGFLALAFEVVWFRALILIFGSTTYSFSAMLSVFLLGIALGPLIFGFLIDRIKQPSTMLVLTSVGIGLYTLLSMYQFEKGPEFLLSYLLRYGFTWASMTVAKFIITITFLLVPTILFGVAFAVAAKMVRDLHVSPSRTVGSVYASNTIGSVTGAFFAGFIFLPFIGMEVALLVLSCLALFLALFVLYSLSDSRVLRTSIISFVLLMLLLIVLCPPRWDKRVLVSGAYFGPWNFIKNGQITFRERILSDRLLLYEEGLSSTASVSKSEDESTSFCIDGKTEADTTPRGMMLQRMMGHLPMLFHPDPRRVLNVGLGAGVTLGALACYPADHVEAVEIEPVVQKVAWLWQNFNHRVLSRTNVIITINDGRNHLFATAQKYDVITADPFEPMMAGAANLYTVEHFLQAKDRLENGGVMAQFLPLYELSREDVRMIQNSFSAVFTNTLVFFAGYETILLGFKDGTRVNWQILQQKFNISGVRDSMKEIGISGPGMILGMFVGKLPASVGAESSARLNTDEFPVIEFSAPKSALKYMADYNQQVLLDSFTEIPAEILIGSIEQDCNTVAKSRVALRKTLEASISRSKNAIGEACSTLLKAIELDPENPIVRTELLATLSLSVESMFAAGELVQTALQSELILKYQPDDFWALYHLVDLSMRAKNADRAKVYLERGLARYPKSPLFIALKGKYRGAMGDPVGACADLRAALDELPGKSDIWNDYIFFLGVCGNSTGVTKAKSEAARAIR